MDDATRQEIIRRKQAGDTVPAICAAVGLKKSSVYSVLTMAGVTFNHGSEKERRKPEISAADMMEAVEISRLQKEVRKMLRRYQNHPEFEDMLGTAYLEMWKALQSVAPTEARRVSGLAMHAARHGAIMFLMSPASRYRRWNHEGRELPWIESLDALLDGAAQREGRDCFSPVEPDFAPALIERLWVIETWEKAAAHLTELEREVIGRTVFEGDAPAAIGGEVGLSQGMIYHIRQQGLNRIRRQLGVPVRSAYE